MPGNVNGVDLGFKIFWILIPQQQIDFQLIQTSNKKEVRIERKAFHESFEKKWSPGRR